MKEIKLYKLGEYLLRLYEFDCTSDVRVGIFKSKHDREVYGIIPVQLDQVYYGSVREAIDTLSEELLDIPILSVKEKLDEWEKWICLDKIEEA